MMSVENTIMEPVVAQVAQATKRGRPKKVVDPSAVKADAPVGRPKKSTKVTELARSEDLFLELVREASEPVIQVFEEVKPQATQEEVKVDAKAEAKAQAKAAKDQEKADAKAAKEQAQAEAKAAKEAIKAAKAAITPEMKEQAKAEAKAVKEQAKVEAKAVKEQAKADAKAAKEQEKAHAKLEKEKAQAEAKLAKEAINASKAQAKAEKSVAKAEKVAKKAADEPVEDVVKRFEFEGEKYLRSKTSGLIYNMDQDVIGKWNEEDKKIEFNVEADEESEDEYDEL